MAKSFNGRTERNEIVHFGCLDNPTGQLLPMRIERALKHSLVGTLTDPARAVAFEQAVQNAATPIQAALEPLAAPARPARHSLPMVTG